MRCLTESGYDNTVCTYHHGRDVAGVTTVRISPIKNYTQTQAGPSKYKLWADWKLLWLAVKQYRNLKPAVIHAHLHEGLMIGIIVKWLFFWRRTPVVGDMQGSLSGELETHGSFNKLPLLKFPVRLIERLLMWFADHIVCSSKHSLQKIASEFSISSNKIGLAQDGADSVTPMTTLQRQELSEQLGLPRDKTLVVYSGALLDAKGLQELKQIIQACGVDRGLHFLIIGYPVENLLPFLEEYGLTDICTLTGQVNFEQLPQYLTLADIAIDPKFTDAGEGSGKMLNYLACGLPVAAFDTRNNQEFLPADSELFTNAKDLASYLIRLSDDEALRSKTAAANLTHFSENYSWQVTRQQLEAAYSVILNN